MAKERYVIDSFNGGLNTYVDPTALEKNEFSALVNLTGDKKGKIRSVGYASSVFNIGDSAPQPGYGIYVTHSDYEWSGTLGASEDMTGDNIFFVGDSGGALYTFSESASTVSEIDSVVGDANTLFGFENADGNIRIYDAARGSIGQKWVGYIKRTMFQYNSASYLRSLNGWFIEDANILAPAGGYASNDTIRNPASAHYVNMYLTASGDGIGWDKEFEVAVTFVYDYNQESMLKVLDFGGSLTAVGGFGSASGAKLHVKVSDSGTSWRERITSINIYIREIDTDDWYMLASVDVAAGAEKVIEYHKYKRES